MTFGRHSTITHRFCIHFQCTLADTGTCHWCGRMCRCSYSCISCCMPVLTTCPSYMGCYNEHLRRHYKHRQESEKNIRFGPGIIVSCFPLLGVSHHLLLHVLSHFMKSSVVIFIEILQNRYFQQRNTVLLPSTISN